MFGSEVFSQFRKNTVVFLNTVVFIYRMMFDKLAKISVFKIEVLPKTIVVLRYSKLRYGPQFSKL
jgi:hypothetical protein